jgi:hypothetical protein
MVDKENNKKENIQKDDKIDATNNDNNIISLLGKYDALINQIQERQEKLEKSVVQIAEYLNNLGKVMSSAGNHEGSQGDVAVAQNIVSTFANLLQPRNPAGEFIYQLGQQMLQSMVQNMNANTQLVNTIVEAFKKKISNEIVGETVSDLSKVIE